MIAFWEYDTFPFVSWGEVKEVRTNHYGPCVEINGYQGMVVNKDRVIAILSEEDAKPAIEQIEFYALMMHNLVRGLREKVDLTLEKLPKPHWNLLLEGDRPLEGAL